MPVPEVRIPEPKSEPSQEVSSAPMVKVAGRMRNRLMLSALDTLLPRRTGSGGNLGHLGGELSRCDGQPSAVGLPAEHDAIRVTGRPVEDVIGRTATHRRHHALRPPPAAEPAGPRLVHVVVFE